MKHKLKNWPTSSLLGIPLDCPDKPGLLAYLLACVSEGQTPCHVVTINAEMAYAASQDAELMQLLQQADVVIPDGIGVVWALRRQGLQVQRVPGVEVVEALFQLAPEKDLRLAILGSSTDTLSALKTLLPKRFGGVELVFAHHGYFQPAEEAALVAQIQAAQPDILFVALGVPRQEAWIARHRSALAVPVMMGVGGSFDVISGRLERAPAWMRRLHLEWFFRLLQQPSRWRRMLALPQFVLKVMRT